MSALLKMLFEKFSNIIDRSPIGKAVDYRQKLIEETNPDRIYVENIRSFFHIPFGLAQWLCDEAVREGLFEKRFGLLCPNCDSMIWDFADGEQPPLHLQCESCQVLDEEKSRCDSSACRKIPFYRLVKVKHGE